MAVNKRHVCKQETFNDVFAVLAWSLMAAATGTHPRTRHDNAPWLPGERRGKDAGKPLAAAAVVCEVKGDWVCFNDLFKFPAWNKGSGCCWLCKATPADVSSSVEFFWDVPCNMFLR